MTRSRQAMMAAVAAGFGGFALGFVSSPRQDSRSATSSESATAGKSVSAAPMAFRGGQNPLQPEGERALLDTIRSGGKKEATAALQDVIANKSLPPIVSGVYRDALIARLVKLGASNELLESGQFPASERREIVNAVMKALTASDPDDAIALVKQLTPAERVSAMAALFTTLGGTDPKRGLALLESDPAMKGAKDAFYIGWAKRDPRAAADDAVARGKEYGGVQRNVVNTWALQDPDAAWKWIKAQPEEIQDITKDAWLGTLSWSNPEFALKALATMPELSNTFFARYAADGIGSGIASNAKEASAAVDMLPPGETRTEMISGIARTLSSEPDGAIAWIRTLLPGEQEKAFDELFTTLGLSDPAQALDLAKSELEGPQRQKAMGSIISGWAMRDFDAAFDAMLKKLNPDELKESLDTIFQYHRSMGSEEDEARQFAAISKLDPKLRADVLRAKGGAAAYGLDEETLQQVGQWKPEDRAAFAEGALPRQYNLSESTIRQLIAMLPPEKQAALAPDIGRAMARTDYAGAAEFLKRLPEGDHGPDIGGALNAVVRDWVFAEPDAATAFVAQLPVGAAKDTTTKTLVEQLRTFDLEAATRVAAAATPEVRSELIENLARDWAKVDAGRGREIMTPLLQSKDDRTHAAALFGKP